MLRTHFSKENITIHVPEGTNLRAACLEHGIDPYPALGGLLSCHGKGLCGTCLVQVDDDEAMSPPEKREAAKLRSFPMGIDGLRLSCRAKVVGDVIVDTDPDLKPAWRAHSFYSGQRPHIWKNPTE